MSRRRPFSFLGSSPTIERPLLQHSVRHPYLGSYLALVDLYLGRADAAVVHLYDRKSNTYNIPYVQRLAPGMPVSIVRIARRPVGAIVQAGNPKRIHSWGSILTRGASLVNAARLGSIIYES